MGTSMGVTVYTFPTHNQDREIERHRERKTSIKADSVHNLKRRSSSEEMLCCCCYSFVWVVCFGKVDDADAKMNWMAWLDLAWHTETHIRRTQCKKVRKEKEVNCRLLSENESVCRKRHSRLRLRPETRDQRDPHPIPFQQETVNRFSGPATINNWQLTQANNPNNSSFS